MGKAMIILLIAMVVLLVLPGLGMAAAMRPCPDCAPGTGVGAWGMCLAVLFVLAVVAPLATTSVPVRPGQPSSLLFPILVHRPPRSC
jgi:hypothetical protein